MKVIVSLDWNDNASRVGKPLNIGCGSATNSAKMQKRLEQHSKTKASLSHCAML